MPRKKRENVSRLFCVLSTWQFSWIIKELAESIRNLINLEFFLFPSFKGSDDGSSWKTIFLGGVTRHFVELKDWYLVSKVRKRKASFSLTFRRRCLDESERIGIRLTLWDVSSPFSRECWRLWHRKCFINLILQHVFRKVSWLNRFWFLTWHRINFVSLPRQL